LDYLGSTCPRLLLEPQRSNLALYSEQFNNSAWTKNNATLTANQAVSPDGYTNADLFYINSAGDVSSHRIIQSATVSSGTTYTSSVFFKSNAAQWIWFPAPDASSANHEAWFDVKNGVVGTVGSSVTNASIVSYGNGWYRCSVTSAATSITNYVIFAPVTANGSTTTVSGSSNALFIYGAGLEAGAYATSYIPTLGTSVTRVADAALTGSVPSLIGQTEGTLFIEITRDNIFEPFFVMLSTIAGTTTNSYQNGFYLFQLPNTNFVSDGFVSNSQQFGFNIDGLSLTTHKIALAYKQNDITLYIDGVNRGTDTSANIPAMNYLTIGGNADSGATRNIISQALLFKTRLTNAQLAELTTL
jgi:hypothetical protein